MNVSNENVALMTRAEVATYLRFRTASGIRTAVMRGELRPAGAGRKGSSGALRILFRLVSQATAMIQTGMTFGVNPVSHRPGDVLIAKTIVPNDDRFFHDRCRVRGLEMIAGLRMALQTAIADGARMAIRG